MGWALRKDVADSAVKKPLRAGGFASQNRAVELVAALAAVASASTGVRRTQSLVRARYVQDG